MVPRGGSFFRVSLSSSPPGFFSSLRAAGSHSAKPWAGCSHGGPKQSATPPPPRASVSCPPPGPAPALCTSIPTKADRCPSRLQRSAGSSHVALGRRGIRTSPNTGSTGHLSSNSRGGSYSGRWDACGSVSNLTGPAVRLPLLQRALASALLRVVTALGFTIHASFGGPGDDEPPHIVHPLLSSMDCVLVTPPHGPLPPLFGPIHPEQCPRYRGVQSLPDDIRVGHTYTLSYFSRYMDLEAWALTDVPGIGSVDLRRLWGNSSLRFVLYAQPSDRTPHQRTTRQTFLQFQILHPDSHPS
eukprot:TRINITY_DN5560_c0_g1_i1.p1 TRINITY_DN5560_c0_g1~~TRINITY_DN5560_c0_g1_i1.p1  ORF type:complete len:299 (+),score=17.05 TRINITY_DN5560_c0_g1_i1:69-965(+)